MTSFLRRVFTKSFQDTPEGKSFYSAIANENLEEALRIGSASDRTDENAITQLMKLLRAAPLAKVAAATRSTLFPQLAAQGIGGLVFSFEISHEEGLSILRSIVISPARSRFIADAIAVLAAKKSLDDYRLLVDFLRADDSVKMNVALEPGIYCCSSSNSLDFVCHVLQAASLSAHPENFHLLEALLPSVIDRFSTSLRVVMNTRGGSKKKLLSATHYDHSQRVLLSLESHASVDMDTLSSSLSLVLDASADAGCPLINGLVPIDDINIRRLLAFWLSEKKNFRFLNKNSLARLFLSEWVENDEDVADSTFWILTKVRESPTHSTHVVELCVKTLAGATGGLVPALTSLLLLYFESGSQEIKSAFLGSDIFQVISAQLAAQGDQTTGDTWDRLMTLLLLYIRDKSLRPTIHSKVGALLEFLLQPSSLPSAEVLLQTLLVTSSVFRDQRRLVDCVRKVWKHLENTSDTDVVFSAVRVFSSALHIVEAKQDEEGIRAFHDLQVLIGGTLSPLTFPSLIQKISIQNPASLNACVTLYVRIVRTNSETRRFIENNTKSEELVAELFKAFPSPEVVSACFRCACESEVLEGSSLTNAGFLKPILVHCVSHGPLFLESFVGSMQTILYGSRTSCFRVGTTSVLEDMCEMFVAQPTNEALTKCIANIMREFVSTQQLKFLLTRVLKSEESSRAMVSAQTIHLLDISCALCQLCVNDPRQFFSFAPTVGSSGLVFRVSPETFSDGIRIQFSLRIESDRKQTVLFEIGEAGSKGPVRETIRLFTKGRRVCLQSASETCELDNLFFDAWQSVNIFVLPPKFMMNLGRVTATIGTSSVSVKLEVPFQGPIDCGVGNDIKSFVERRDEQALVGSVAAINVFSTANDRSTLIFPGRGGSNKALVVGPDVTLQGIGSGTSCQMRTVFESIVNIGCVQNVLLPLLALWSNEAHPFTEDHLSGAAGQTSDQPIIDSLSLMRHLIRSEAARVEIFETGALNIIASVIKRHIAHFSQTAATVLVGLCFAASEHDIIFESATRALLLNGALLEGMPEESLLTLLNEVQKLMGNAELRAKLRSFGFIRFVTTEVVGFFSVESGKQVREILLRLLEVHLEDTLPLGHVEEVFDLISHALHCDHVVALELTYLCRSFFRTASLVEHLGKLQFGVLLVGLLDHTVDAIRHEAIRLFGRLIQASRTTQQLFNAKLLLRDNGGGVTPEHVLADVSLTFIADRLRRFGVTSATYNALKDACMTYSPLANGRWRLHMPNFIVPMLRLLEDSTPELRLQLLRDLDSVLRSDAVAWAGIIALPSWYVHLCDVLLRDEPPHGSPPPPDAGPQKNAFAQPPPPHAQAQHTHHSAFATIFSKALRVCTFFTKEIRLTCSYFSSQADPRMRVLKVDLLIHLLGEARRLDPTSSVMRANVVDLLALVEEEVHSGLHDRRLVLAYLNVSLSEDFSSRLFGDDRSGIPGFMAVVAAGAKACEEPDLSEALDQACTIAQQKIRGFGASGRFRAFCLPLVFILYNADLHKGFRALCNRNAKGLQLKVSVCDDFIQSKRGMNFIFEAQSAFSLIPPPPDSSDSWRGQLHTVVVSANLAKQAILSEISSTLSNISRNIALKPNTVSNAKLARAQWGKFVASCQDTVWRAPPQKMVYLKQGPSEQLSLRRYKMTPDPAGTNHADIATRADERKMSVLMVKHTDADDDTALEFAESDDDLPTLAQTASGAGHAGEVPTHMECSVRCTVVFHMICWSASLRIVSNTVELEIDATNIAYNQPVSKDAERFVQRPPSQVWPLSAVSSYIHGKRFRMQRTAAEIHFSDRTVVFIHFSEVDSKQVLRIMEQCKTVAVTHMENPRKRLQRERLTDRWRNREMSNFEYLLHLNELAGRSIHDLTQYPVFPWIVADFTSQKLDLSNPSTFRDLRLPVGLCGRGDREGDIRERYDEMQAAGDIPFHYFTHYSSAAVVLYYLLRLEPYTTLQIILQGGKFDHADRLFHSIASTWNGVTKNIQDVKELIPEFFYLPEAFQNHNQVFFGLRQDKTTIDELQLPPWAHGSPHEFVYLMRQALESDHVSSMLHHWIDLIFGYKQRGSSAVDSLNLFHPHTYENERNRHEAVPVDVINSLDNIGQTPIQLFTRKHPERSLDTIVSSWREFRLTNWRICAATTKKHHGPVAMLLWENKLHVARSDTCMFTFSTQSTPIRAKGAGLTDIIFRGGQMGASFDVSPDPETFPSALGGCVECTVASVAFLPVGNDVFALFGGHFDHRLVARGVYSKKTRFFAAHNDVITRVVVADDLRLVLTVGLDTVIHLWRRDDVEILAPLLCISSHESHITDAACSGALDMVVSASKEGQLLVHTASTRKLEWSEVHPQKHAFTKVAFAPHCYVPHVLAYSAADGTLRQFSLNGILLRAITCDAALYGIFPLVHQQVTVLALGGKLALYHSFNLDPIFDIDVDDDVFCLATHPSNPQVLVLGGRNGGVSMLRHEAPPAQSS